VTRGEAVAFAAEQYPETALALGVTATGWKVAVDRTWRQLLGATAGTVEDARAADAELLLRAYALARLYAAAAPRVDVSVAAGDATASKKYGQMVASLRLQLEDARAEVEAAGLTATSGWTQGSIPLDFLEPSGAWA
jgi:hypothetical protein